MQTELCKRLGIEFPIFAFTHCRDVVVAVSKAGGPAVDKRRIEIGQPIKTVGDHQVTVRLHPEVVATLTVQVVAAA